MIILIVEDVLLELQRTSRIIREAAPDSEIHAYSNPKLAKKDIIQRTFRPDVAFLDIEMPLVDGTELARILCEAFPEVNIIFATAYDHYMQQALDMFVSGYLLKPFSLQQVQKQLKNLRHPIAEKQPDYFARTIGEFDFFYRGKPVAFTLMRAKEMLAYLIDRRGASVTKRELFSILFEDAEYNSGNQDYMNKITQALKTSLRQVGAIDILLHSHNSYAIDMSRISTDLPDLDKQKDLPYMEQYSWAEG